MTGAEVSISNLPAGAGVPFVHSHKQNEEIYAVLSGRGTMVPLSARCLYSSILSALCVAISRFESQPASPRRPFTNRSTTATTTSQPSSAAPMAQNLPSSLPISHNQTTNQAATLSHNITTFTPSDTTPKHPPYKPPAAHKPPAAAQPESWNSRPYKPRSTPYSAPYQ